MKRVILFLVFATLLSQGVRAQNSAHDAEIDIRAILSEQIENARKKAAKNRQKEVFSEKKNVNEKQALVSTDEIVAEAKSDEKDELAEIAAFIENTKKNIWTKLTKLPPFKRKLLPYFLIIELFLIGTILAVLFLSRRKNTSKGTRSYNLKETVKKMREEKLLNTNSNSEISKLRNALTAKSIRLDDGGRELVSFAKKSGISKGELLLAMKVKMLSVRHK